MRHLVAASLGVALTVLTCAVPAGAAGEEALAKAQDAATALARGNLQVALTLYTEALADPTLTNDRRALMLSDRGVVYGRLNLPRQSLEDLNRAIQIFPENASAYNNRGNTLLALGLMKEAIKDFDRALVLAPGYVAAYNNRAGAYLRLGQTGEAIRDYTKAIELMPTSAAPLSGRGRVLLSQQRPEAALRDFTRALKSDPRLTVGYRLRAEAHIQKERYDEAVEDLSRALAFDGNNRDLLMLRGRTYLMAGNVASAIKDYSRAIEIGPNDGAAYEARGQAHTRAEAFEDAEADLVKAIELNPRSALGYAFRAVLFKLTNQPEVAAREIDKAVRIEPGNAHVQWAKGEVAEARGRVDEAVAAYRAAIKADPSLIDARIGLQRLGILDQSTGDVDVPGSAMEGWRVILRRDRYYAVHPSLGNLRVPLEAEGEAVPRLLDWDTRTPFPGFGLLRFSAGQVSTPTGALEIESVALINITDRLLVAIEAERRGERRSTWTWGDGRLTVAAIDGVTDEFMLRAPSRAGDIAAAGAAQQDRKAVAPPVRSAQQPRRQKSLFDLIFGN